MQYGTFLAKAMVKLRGDYFTIIPSGSPSSTLVKHAKTSLAGTSLKSITKIQIPFSIV